jgi:hypothetical protein
LIVRGVVLVMLVGCWRGTAPTSEPPPPRPDPPRTLIAQDPPRRLAIPPDVSGVVPRPVSFAVGSPGALVAGHAAWDNPNSCNVCHSDAQPDVPPGKCVACHAPIASRIAASRGVHGDPKLAGKRCESCHHEHKGRRYDLMGWKSVPGGSAGFDHARTGWPLPRAYAAMRCTQCHVTIDQQGLQLYLDADRAQYP